MNSWIDAPNNASRFMHAEPLRNYLGRLSGAMNALPYIAGGISTASYLVAAHYGAIDHLSVAGGFIAAASLACSVTGQRLIERRFIKPVAEAIDAYALRKEGSRFLLKTFRGRACETSVSGCVLGTISFGFGVAARDMLVSGSSTFAIGFVSIMSLTTAVLSGSAIWGHRKTWRNCADALAVENDFFDGPHNEQVQVKRLIAGIKRDYGFR